MHFVWCSSTSFRLYKFVQTKEVGPNFWGEPILQNVWINWSLFWYFNFKSFLDPNSSPFISFQCILYDSGVLPSGSSNFFKLKEGKLIPGGNQFCRMCELFRPPFCISILKVLWTQNLSHSLDFSHFCMNHAGFSQNLRFLQIKDEGASFWEEPILQNVWINWSPLLYFNFKSFLDSNSSPFIRFPSILYDPGVLLSGLRNLYKLKRGYLISGLKQFCRMSELFCPPLLYVNFKSFWVLTSLSYIRF